MNVLVIEIAEISRGEANWIGMAERFLETQFTQPLWVHFIMKTGKYSAAKIHETTAPFKFMDLSSLDAVSDKTNPLIWRDAEPHAGLASSRVQR